MGFRWSPVQIGPARPLLITDPHLPLIEAHFEEISDSLSDAELERMLALAPAIANGTEPESIGARSNDPFASH